MSKPWLPYIVTDYLSQLTFRNVFEWGSGESTLWLAPRCTHLISIEHDLNWYNKLLPKLNYNSAYLYIPYEDGEIGPDKSNPLHYKSGSTELGKVNFKKYVSVIDNYGLFDLILIDGIARASCLYHAINHITPNGIIVLDNVGDRPYYLEQTDHLFGNWESGWERIEFMGYGPILAYQWKTLLLINRKKDFYSD